MVRLGTLLIKLGFGLAVDCEASEPEWKAHLGEVLKGVPHQVRVHVYQCRHVPAADSNGLSDPFLESESSSEFRGY